MNAPTGRNASVSVIDSAMSLSVLPNSLAIAVSVVTAATSKLLATLRASELVTLVDSSVVAVAVAAAEAGGNPCGNECALAVARRLGARWVAKGTISNLSNLVWLLTAELFDATSGKPVLADSYEIKGDARIMAPAGAHVFAQRVEKTIGGAR